MNKELNPFIQEAVSIANNAEKETPKESSPKKDMLDPAVKKFLNKNGTNDNCRTNNGYLFSEFYVKRSLIGFYFRLKQL